MRHSQRENNNPIPPGPGPLGIGANAPTAGTQLPARAQIDWVPCGRRQAQVK